MTDIERDQKQNLPEQQPAESIDETRQADEASEASGASIEEWREALETAVRQRDEYLAMAQRAQAEFSNFRKRNESARAEAFQDGVCDALSALLPSVDNLERAIAASTEHGERGPLLEGVEMTYRVMMEALGKLGLNEVPALGEKFDPELHNAVMRADEGEPGTILEVFQKGYRVKDRIIRYPMVKVAAE